MHDIDRALFEMQESEAQSGGTANESREMELASELLEVANEQELDRFLGDLAGAALRAGKAFLRTDTGKAVLGTLRSVAKQALPQLGRAVGDVWAPGVGGQIGAQLGGAAATRLGLELEGLSAEDRELEVARAFVRFADQAVRTAATAPPHVPPSVAAATAARTAAQDQLPGLVPLMRRVAGNTAPRRHHGEQATEVLEAQEWELIGEAEQADETSERELVQELLEVTNEEELDRFLGDLVRGAGRLLNSNVGRAVTGALKGIAKTALPAIGAAVGSAIMPGVGTAIGGKLGSFAGGLLEVGEAEQMGDAEAEYEAATRFVRFGRATARYAARAPRNLPAPAVARAAAIAAARRYAPGLLRSRPASFRYQRFASRRPRAVPWQWRTWRPNDAWAQWSPWATEPSEPPPPPPPAGDGWAGHADEPDGSTEYGFEFG